MCKVQKNEAGNWNLVGLGMLKINQHKTSKKARVLLRNEAGGILMNVWILPQALINIPDNQTSKNRNGNLLRV